MTVRRMRWTLVSAMVCVAVTAAMRSSTVSAQAPAPRPMTLSRHAADAQRRIADAEPRRPVDALHGLVAGAGRTPSGRPTSTWSRCDQGISSTKQLTFTTAKNETSPHVGARRQHVLLPLESRSAGQRVDAESDLPDARRRRRGAAHHRRERRRCRLRAGPVGPAAQWRHRLSRGKTDARQLYRLLGWLGSNNVVPTEIATEQLTKQRDRRRHVALFARRPARLLHLARQVDDDEKARREKKFTVNIRNAETPIASLWSLDLSDRKAARIGQEGAYSVSGFTMSDDGKWIGFRAARRSATSATSPPRISTPTSISTKSRPDRSSG